MAAGERRVGLNAALLTLGVVLGSLGSFAFQALVARTYGPNGFGVFSLAVLTATVAAGVAELGLKDGVVAFIGRARARNDADRIAGVTVTSLSLTLLVGTLLAVLVSVFSPAIAERGFGEPSLAPVLRWFAIFIPVQAVVGVTAAVCLSFERGGAQVLVEQVVPKLLLLSLAGAVVWWEYPVVAVAVAYVTAYLLTVPLGLYLVVRLVRETKPTGLETDPETLLRYSTPLLFATLIGTVLNWIDTAIVGYVLDASAVGIYQTAFLLGVSIQIFSSALAGSLYPNFSALLGEGAAETVRSRFERGTAWAVRVTVPGVVYLVAFPEPSLAMLFGPEYTEGATALVVIVLGQVTAVAMGPATGLLKASGESRTVLIANVFALGVNAIVGVALVPIVGILGAAIGTALATFAGNAFQLYRARTHVRVRPRIDELARAGLATTAVAIGFSRFPAPPRPAPFIVHIVIFSVATLGAYLLTGVTSVKELRGLVVSLRSD